MHCINSVIITAPTTKRMARSAAAVLVEESDDELTGFTRLIADKGMAKPEGGKSRDKAGSIPSEGLKVRKLEGYNCVEGFAREEVKPKAKKRVLGKTTENPLLRPFSEEPGTRRKVRARTAFLKTEERTDRKVVATGGGSGGDGDGGSDEERGSRSQTQIKPAKINTTSETQKPRVKPRTQLLEKKEKKTIPKNTTIKATETTATVKEFNRKPRGKSTPREPGRMFESGPLESETGLVRSLTGKSNSKSESPVKLVSEDEEELVELGEDSDDFSNFIVNDSTCLTLQDSDSEAPPPRSRRRLVKGRRPAREYSLDDELELGMEGLEIKDDLEEDGSNPFQLSVDRGDSNRTGNARSKSGSKIEGEGSEYTKLQLLTEDIPCKNKKVGSGKFDDIDKLLGKGMKRLGLDQPSDRSLLGQGLNQRGERPRANSTESIPYSDLGDPFTLRFSPPINKSGTVCKEFRFATPPSSPEAKTRILQSPKKFPQIPSTPHRPSMDSFWDQDVINDWNDEYSPKKTPRPRPKFDLSDNTDHSGGALLFSRPKKGSVKQDLAAKNAKKAFSEKKHALATSFLVELDSAITNNQISTLAASTGGIKIIWSKKLNTTAGRANWKRETIKSSSILLDGKPNSPIYKHYASIELAEKVIDDEDRLLNVIAHEFCHLANFMVSNVKTNPHGKEFKAWGAKVTARFKGRGVNVTTKHSYQIDYKYVWECVNCGLEFKRHSKSIDPMRHQCGSCKCKLVQTKPVPRATTAGARGPKVSEYQLFVKENMKKIREENPGSPQKEIMGLVGKRYKELKASRLGLGGAGVGANETATVSKGGTPLDGDVGDVVRKLDLLDLVSP
ncbi:SprT-like family-domain-containing protein [Tricladium varicosporioides]|nr:SprT-like family-domain-containing protein [Hymenoscyphus varicosporioides]